MAHKFFKNFPEINYRLSDGKFVSIKDFFRKSKIEQEAVSSIVDSVQYEIQDGERPDILAGKLYGDADLHWLFFLVNDIENYYDWYKDSVVFEEYINKKYIGQYAIASSSTDIVSSSSKFLLGEKVTSVSSEGRVILVEPIMNRICIEGRNFVANELITGSVSDKSFTPTSVIEQQDGIDHYKNSDGLKRNSSASGYTSVTHYEKEVSDNDKKRNIKIISPQKAASIVKSFESVMSD